MVGVAERFGLVADPVFEVSELPEGLKISRMSTFTRKRNEMTLPISSSDFLSWRRGEKLIQDAFPNLSADQREFLMSGATPKEWDEVFGSSEDEVNDLDYDNPQ